jgi:methionyl-tRNA formyltransferase
MLHRSLPAILEGKAYGGEQDESQATYFGRRRPEDGLIDWSQSPREIHNLVRAVTHPFPGAFTYLNGEKLFIWKTQLLLEESCITPGVVVSSSPLRVGTGDGALQIEQAQWSAGEESKGDELKLPLGAVLTNNTFERRS